MLLTNQEVRIQVPRLSNFYNIIDGFYNINTIAGFANASTGYAKIRQIAYFADLNIGYKDILILLIRN